MRLLFASLLALACVSAFVGCTAEESAELATYAGINAIRAQNGLPPLKADARLVEAARVRSEDMAARGYFSHNPPDGCNFTCVIDRYTGSHGYAGENIAWNNYAWGQTTAVAVQMWHDSPAHLENILNCHYERFGTGVVEAPDGRIYYTMLFDGMRSC